MDNQLQNKNRLLVITSLLCSSIILIHIYQKPKQDSYSRTTIHGKINNQSKKHN
jgi:hypothetical protein